MFIIGRIYNDRKNGKGHETLKQIIRMLKSILCQSNSILDVHVHVFDHLFKLED